MSRRYFCQLTLSLLDVLFFLNGENQKKKTQIFNCGPEGPVDPIF